VFGEELGNLAGGEALGAPLADHGADLGGDAAARSCALGDGFREVDLAMGEEVFEEAEVAGREPEAVGDDGSGEALDEEGAECLIAVLPRGGGVKEEGCVFHRG